MTAYGIDNLMNLIYYVFIRIIDILCLVKYKIYLFTKIAGLSNKFFQAPFFRQSELPVRESDPFSALAEIMGKYMKT